MGGFLTRLLVVLNNLLLVRTDRPILPVACVQGTIFVFFAIDFHTLKKTACWILLTAVDDSIDGLVDRDQSETIENLLCLH